MDGTDEDWALVGSGLLGGSNDLPATYNEKQAFMRGVQLRAKFIGTIEVPQSHGIAMLNTAISRVRAHLKHTGEPKPKVIFNVSVTGLRIFDVATGQLRESLALAKISYVYVLESDRKVFCFVSVNDTVRPIIFKCHIFKSDTKVGSHNPNLFKISVHPKCSSYFA